MKYELLDWDFVAITANKLRNKLVTLSTVDIANPKYNVGFMTEILERHNGNSKLLLLADDLYLLRECLLNHPPRTQVHYIKRHVVRQTFYCAPVESLEPQIQLMIDNKLSEILL